jgi:hypothetical protein
METQRRLNWVELSLPVELEVLGGPRLEPFPQASLYERVSHSSAMEGARFQGELRNLSAERVLIAAGVVPPLLSRVALTFRLGDCGVVRAIGLLLMRQPQAGEGVEPGFSLVFEATSFEGREALAAFLARSGSTLPPLRPLDPFAPRAASGRRIRKGSALSRPSTRRPLAEASRVRRSRGEARVVGG